MVVLVCVAGYKQKHLSKLFCSDHPKAPALRIFTLLFIYSNGLKLNFPPCEDALFYTFICKFIKCPNICLSLLLHKRTLYGILNVAVISLAYFTDWDGTKKVFQILDSQLLFKWFLNKMESKKLGSPNHRILQKLFQLVSPAIVSVFS